MRLLEIHGGLYRLLDRYLVGVGLRFGEIHSRCLGERGDIVAIAQGTAPGHIRVHGPPNDRLVPARCARRCVSGFTGTVQGPSQGDAGCDLVGLDDAFVLSFFVLHSAVGAFVRDDEHDVALANRYRCGTTFELRINVVRVRGVIDEPLPCPVSFGVFCTGPLVMTLCKLRSD
jgi:hypothetical protein